VAHINFLKADCSFCNLTGIEAAKVIFSFGIFRHAKLDDAVLTASAFSNANLEHASVKHAKLQHSIFQKANLRGVDFSGSNLSHAHLQDADCRDCVFSNCQLENAHFADADLRGCVLDWEALGEAPFVRGVTVTQEEYDLIPRADKETLRLRVVGDNKYEAVLKLISEHELIVFVLGYGSITGDSDLTESYCNEAIRMAKSLTEVESKIVDVVGQSKLIDDLWGLTKVRSWPKVFWKGEFLGGHAKLVEFVAKREKK
jgi:glutaredoxin-related protein